ncbi:hypothetical protein, partial [Salmonella sp. s57359]|uniref:hypothetical protein n=1 Tax=Salmonella sp. s57359 TaxID=3159693 RepID=UPI00398149C8
PKPNPLRGLRNAAALVLLSNTSPFIGDRVGGTELVEGSLLFHYFISSLIGPILIYLICLHNETNFH